MAGSDCFFHKTPGVDIALQQVLGVAVEYTQGFQCRIKGHLQPFKALDIQLLGCLQEFDGLEGQAKVGALHLAVAAVADQGAVCRLKGEGTTVIDRLSAGAAATQFRLISGGTEQAKMKQGNNLQRRGSPVY